MTRFVPLAAIVLMALGGVARADMGTLPNGVVLQYNRLFTHSGNSAAFVQPNLGTEDEWHYFNFAHCECSLDKGRNDADYHESTFAYEIVPTSSGTGTVTRPLQMWVGAMCDAADPNIRAMNCKHVSYADISTIGAIQTSHSATPEISLFDFMNPTGTSQCAEQVLDATLWALTDSDAMGTLNYSLSKAITTDTLAPPLPTQFSANGAENAIDIKWNAPDGSSGDATDIAYYQALCATPDGEPAVADQYRPAPHYVTPQSLCNSGYRLLITQSDVDSLTTTTVDAGASLRFGPGDATTDAAVDAEVDAAVDAGTTVDAAEIDAPQQPTDIPTGFSEYDPTFLCGEADSATATELRIQHLQNGISYRVMLLAIDKFGNPRGTVFRTTLTPKAVTDFWEDLHDQDSHVQGGFCLIADTFGDDSFLTTALRAFRDDNLAKTGVGRWLVDVYYGSIAKLGPIVKGSIALRVVAAVLLSPLIAIALLWHYLTFAGLLIVLALPLAYRHRRKILRSRLAGATAAIALLCLLPRAAHADTSGHQPYWAHDNETSSDALADEPALVHWQVGVRLGPYTPQIDAQLGKSPGPYAEMFGKGASVLPMLDFDRVVWHGDGIGTFAAGISLGYMTNSAYAFEDMTTPGDPNRPRSTGDKTSFSLVPIGITAAYRATMLDDDYNIPIVPFVRVGLGYYVWWIKGPSGNLAYVCKSGAPPDCPKDSADGASLGLTGEIGITVRAERIDVDAARSMRESGLLHAGFFAEYELAKVDGFGSAKKLAVGDNTWYAGVSFEF